MHNSEKKYIFKILIIAGFRKENFSILISVKQEMASAKAWRIKDAAICLTWLLTHHPTSTNLGTSADLSFLNYENFNKKEKHHSLKDSLLKPKAFYLFICFAFNALSLSFLPHSLSL